MASQTPGVMRRSMESMRDEDLRKDVAKSYASVTAANAAPVRILQKIGRLWLKFDSQKRGQTRARRALAVLVGLPPAENANWGFEQSLRLALAAAVNEEGEAQTLQMYESASTGKDPEGYLADVETDNRVRSIFRAAIRLDAGQEDVSRVLAALRKVEKDDAAEEENDGEWNATPSR